MNLILRARDVLMGVSPKLVDEFDYLTGRINFVWTKGHNAQTGEHKNLQFDANTVTSLTVGPAGLASALPATPEGYLTIVIDGTPVVIPYYSQG
jgi:hypothetical protein